MEVNPRGIPRAPFVVSVQAQARATLVLSHGHDAHSQADVDEYVGGPNAEIDSVIKTFQETSA